MKTEERERERQTDRERERERREREVCIVSNELLGISRKLHF